MLSVGSLVTIAKFNLTLKKHVDFVKVMESPDIMSEKWDWLHGEIGVIIALDDSYEFAQVLHKERVGWVFQEHLRVIKTIKLEDEF